MVIMLVPGHRPALFLVLLGEAAADHVLQILIS